ncbi:phosphoglycerate kinase [Candidatus Dependentiae bacterium]|nr:phosphoglycerate kinase [Candidatus Dependentiae bacterium]
MLYNLSSHIVTIPDHARVILRVDANVSTPITAATAFRLQSFLPTIHLLQQKKCSIVLLSHRGRPTTTKQSLEDCSMEPIVAWLQQQQLTAHLATTITEAADLSYQLAARGSVIVLENIRFFSGELANDVAFAEQLTVLGDYYVNDAFGCCHEMSSSMTLLPTYYNAAHKTIGLQVAKELTTLNAVKSQPQRPFVALLGGGKAAEKLPYVLSLATYADAILTLPLLDEAIEHHLMRDELANKIQLPVDYVVRNNGAIETIEAPTLSASMQCISVGDRTVQQYRPLLDNAGTIFCNGLSGFPAEPATMAAAQELLQIIATSKAYTIIAGGDTVTAAYTYNVAQAMDFCSTGGGATLAYLADAPMPALEMLL